MKPCIYYTDHGLRTVNDVLNEYAATNNIAIVKATSRGLPDDCYVEWQTREPLLVFGNFEFLMDSKEKSPKMRDYIFFDHTNFTPQKFTELFERRYMFCTGQERTVFELSTEWYGTTEPVHVQANGYRSKRFPPEHYTRKEFYLLSQGAQLHPEQKLWVDRNHGVPGKSYMVWVAGDKAIATTQYKKDGKLDVDPHLDCYLATEFVKEHVIGKFPEFAYCVSLTVDGGYDLRISDITCIHNTLWIDKDLGLTVIEGWMKALIQREEEK
jgi:hypothetical protein